MKNPFEKKQDLDQSVWADWLSDDNQNSTTAKASTRKATPRPHFPSNFSGFSHTSKPSQTKPAAKPGPKPLVIDPHRFQEQRMQAFLNRQPQPPNDDKKKARYGRKEIALSIRMPEISVAKIRQWRPSRRLVRSLVAATGLAVVLGLMVFTPKILNSDSKTATKTASGGSKTIPKSFAELTPEESKSVTNERYDASRGFYTFNDNYKGGNITVTEQQLPDNVRNDAEKGKELAQSVGATDDYETTQGTLYLTLSDTKTAQRAVLLHRQLLVFIQSTQPLDPTSWVDYVQSLQ